MPPAQHPSLVVVFVRPFQELQELGLFLTLQGHEHGGLATFLLPCVRSIHDEVLGHGLVALRQCLVEGALVVGGLAVRVLPVTELFKDLLLVPVVRPRLLKWITGRLQGHLAGFADNSATRFDVTQAHVPVGS